MPVNQLANKPQTGLHAAHGSRRPRRRIRPRPPRPAEPRPARGRAARRRRGRRAAPRHRRRRHRQDQHPRASPRASRPRRRRPAPHPAHDLLAPRGGRDDPPRRAHRGRGDGPEGVGARRGADLGRHLPRDRRPAAARPCRRHRPRPRLHHPRPRGFGRPDEPRAPPPRLLGDRAALSGQGHLPRDLLARGQRPGAARRGARPPLPLVRRVGAGAEGALRRLRRGQAGERRPRLRRPAALLGRDDAGAGARRRDRRPLRPCPRRRVPGHQPAAGGDPARAEAGRPRPDRGRRRRPVDLRLPRRGGAQHPRLPGALHAAGPHRHARGELSLDAARSSRRRTR